MWPNRVSNPGPLTYESGILPIALRDPVPSWVKYHLTTYHFIVQNPLG